MSEESTFRALEVLTLLVRDICRSNVNSRTDSHRDILTVDIVIFVILLNPGACSLKVSVNSVPNTPNEC